MTEPGDKELKPCGFCDGVGWYMGDAPLPDALSPRFSFKCPKCKGNTRPDEWIKIKDKTDLPKISETVILNINGRVATGYYCGPTTVLGRKQCWWEHSSGSVGVGWYVYDIPSWQSLPAPPAEVEL